MCMMDSTTATTPGGHGHNHPHENGIGMGMSCSSQLLGVCGVGFTGGGVWTLDLLSG
jgi:hypothetical protein